MSSKIQIFHEGGRQGFGHLRRCEELANTLASRGHDVHRHPILKEPPPAPEKSLWESALWIIDLPSDSIPHFRTGKEKGIPTLALDYFGPDEPSLTISVLERPNLQFRGPRLAGLQFAIVRQEIREQVPPPIGEGVLVVIGGGDIRDIGLQVAKEVVRMGYDVTLVQGPTRSTPYSTDIPGVHVVNNPSDLPELLSTCQWAVSNGGVTMMELLHLGKPVHVIPQTVDEARLAHHVNSKGALLGVGLDSLEHPSNTQQARASHSAKALVDGHGTERIITLAEELI